MAFAATRPGAKMDRRVQLHAPERSLSFREEEQKQEEEGKGIAKVRGGENGNSGTSTTFDEGEDDDSVCKMGGDLQEHLNYCCCNRAVSLLSREKREKRGSLSPRELQESILRAEEARDERSIFRLGSENSFENFKHFDSSCCFSDSQTATVTATTTSNTRRSLSRLEAQQQLELLRLYAHSGDLACDGTAGPSDTTGAPIGGGGDDTVVNNNESKTPPRRKTRRRGVGRSYGTCGFSKVQEHRFLCDKKNDSNPFLHCFEGFIVNERSPN